MKRSRHAAAIGLAPAICCSTFLLMLISPGCGKDTTVAPRYGIPTGHLVDYSTCKNGSTGTGSAASVENEDCVAYALTAGGTLSLRHVNAAFNCCPTDLLADITIRNDTITIVERDSLANPCDCLCLYDLDYQFENIDAGTYTFVFVEPYTNEGDPPLKFTVQLTPSAPGGFCVTRDHYPWAGETFREPTGTLVSHSGCLGEASFSLPQDTTFFQKECAIYGYDNYTLLLTHVNAVFNCCPDDITGEVIITGDTIRFIGHEILTNPCLCVCPYNLDYRVDDLLPGTYTFILGPPENDSHNVAFTASLSSSPYDTFCVRRTGNPWGGSAGRLISHTACKTGTSALVAETVPGDLDCAEYHFGANGVLSLTHINAAFNCCPGEITADISVSGGVITIVEHEESSMCDCSCLYDLRYEISNLQPVTYRVRIIGLYLQPDERPLEFSIDLSAMPDGFVGMHRNHYPWGYQSTMPSDELVLGRMRQGIIDFIGTPACGGNGDCRRIAFGAKPCGGPWEYLVYSASTVDVNALAFMVSRYNVLNDGFNQRYNVASDCMFVLPPRMGCVGGVCKAVDGVGR